MNPDEFLDALLTLPGLAGTSVSHDGRWVAWGWARVGPTIQVYAAPTDGSAPAVQLTDTGENTFPVRWTPDGNSLLVAHDRGGDERIRLFRVDLAQPGTLVPLIEENPAYFLRGGDLHPNGRWLIYAMNYDVATGQEIEQTWVYRHDLLTGERRVLARPLKNGYVIPRLNETGTHVLYNRHDLDPAGNQIWLVDIEGNDDREVLNYGSDVKVHAGWFPDGQHALVLAEAPTHRRVEAWDRLTGTTRVLLDDPARNIESAYVPAGTDGRYAVIVEIREAVARPSLLDTATGEETTLAPVPGNLIPMHPVIAPAGEATSTENTQHATRNTWVASYSSAQQPADVVRVDLANLQPAAFASLTGLWERTEILPSDLAPAESFHWEAPDGLSIQGWIYRATPPARGTIVYIHGGPTSHSSDALNAQIQFFVSQGFNVFDPNYRGSTGFSLAFREAIREDGWGGREQDDVRSGIKALIAAGLAEPGCVGMTGTSYGGYTSWFQITHTPPDLLAAAAPICGMTDLVVDYETTRPDLRPYSEEMLGGTPAQVPERYHERSPIHFVGNIQGRLLIVQGAKDPNVTPENVRAVEAALQAAGVPYDVLTFADEGHGISRPANQRVLYARLVEFFGTAFAATT